MKPRNKKKPSFVQVVKRGPLDPSNFPSLPEESEQAKRDKQIRAACLETNYMVPFLMMKLDHDRLPFHTVYGILASYLQDCKSKALIPLDSLMWDIAQVFREKFFTVHNIRKLSNCVDIYGTHLTKKEREQAKATLHTVTMLANLSRHTSPFPDERQTVLTLFLGEKSKSLTGSFFENPFVCVK